MSQPAPNGVASRLARQPAARAQGWYYVVTGAWPLLSMPSFELVTGRKRDRWLVRTVALLLGVIGSSLLLADREGRVTPEVRTLGIGTAASLGVIDVVYVLRGTIRPVYLLDALVEAAFIAMWRR